MKKLMYVELGVLAAVLIVAILACSYLMSPAFSPDGLYAGNNNVNITLATKSEPTITWNTYPDDRQITAQQYFVYDCRKKDFVTISGQKDDRIYPASITKLFTAYVVMQHLHPDNVYTVGDALDLVAPGSSVAGLKKGDKVSAKVLLAGTLLPSGNDAAYVLACETGKVIADDPTLSAAAAVDVFVTEMNTQAQELGMKNTHFVNPDGIHDVNHYTTFKDLAILGTLCMDDPSLTQLCSFPSGTVSVNGETRTWKNTNALIDTSSPYYCPYATGLKTGQTPNAGSCLLASFKMSGKFLLVGVFGCPTETDRFDDTLQLFNQTILN